MQIFLPIRCIATTALYEMVLNIVMKQDDTDGCGENYGARRAGFSHLPFSVDIPVADLTYCDGCETIQGRWCDIEIGGAWDWDYFIGTSIRRAPLEIRFYFEFEDDALLFKLVWF